jgi:lysosomal alpha-mannosidase
MEREGNNILQICKQLDALTGIDQVHSFGDVSLLREAMGVLQHHDAVSGTAKQAVTFDYAQRLSDGIGECERIISGALARLTDNSQQAEVAEAAPEFRFCRLLNVSQCDVTEKSSAFVVNVYNPLARRVTKFVRVPIAAPGYDVIGPDGKAVPTQVVPGWLF